jgi:hypothetical protein
LIHYRRFFLGSESPKQGPPYGMNFVLMKQLVNNHSKFRLGPDFKMNFCITTEKECQMKKFSILFICIVALMAFAISVPGAFAFSGFYNQQCSSCHGTSPTSNPSDGATCMGCHHHGGTNITATPDKTEYAPGDTVMVTLSRTGTDRGGWIGAKLFDKDCSVVACDTSVTGPDVIDFGSNPCPSCPIPSGNVGGLNGITTQYPVILAGTAPDTAGTYTWSAAWHGNPSGSSFGTHRDVHVQFAFDVVPLNAGPVANNDAFIAPQDTALTVDAPGVLGNDSDVDGDSLTAVLVTNATRGTRH